MFKPATLYKVYIQSHFYFTYFIHSYLKKSCLVIFENWPPTKIPKLNLLGTNSSVENKKNLHRHRNSKAEPSVICQYVCQSFLFVQPIRS